MENTRENQLRTVARLWIAFQALHAGKRYNDYVADTCVQLACAGGTGAELFMNTARLASILKIDQSDFRNVIADTLWNDLSTAAQN